MEILSGKPRYLSAWWVSLYLVYTRCVLVTGHEWGRVECLYLGRPNFRDGAVFRCRLCRMCARSSRSRSAMMVKWGGMFGLTCNCCVRLCSSAGFGKVRPLRISSEGVWRMLKQFSLLRMREIMNPICRTVWEGCNGKIWLWGIVRETKGLIN